MKHMQCYKLFSLKIKLILKSFFKIFSASKMEQIRENMCKKFRKVRTFEQLEELKPLSLKKSGLTDEKYDEYRYEFEEIYDDLEYELKAEEKFDENTQNRDKDIKIKLYDYMNRIKKGDSKTTMSYKVSTFLLHCGANNLINGFESSRTVGGWYDWYHKKLRTLYGITGRAPNKKKE